MLGLCHFSSSEHAGYRFGFNGMEKDGEVTNSNGNSYTTPFRQLDPRLGGRWWSRDPIVKPWESPYAGFANNPIYFADPSGLDVEGDGGKKPKKPKKPKGGKHATRRIERDPPTNVPDGQENGGGRKEKADKKFHKNITVPLQEMEREGARPDEIQSEADRLARKYQRKRWLHYSYGIPNNPAAEKYKGSLTGADVQQEIGIKAYQTTIIGERTLGDERSNDDVISMDNTGLIAPVGSTVDVQFDPYEVPNALYVFTSASSSAQEFDVTGTNGMISNPDGSNIFSSKTVIGTTNAGELIYRVENSGLLKHDKWNLKIKVTSAPVLNPIPIVKSNFPFP